MSIKEHTPERTCVACREVHPKRELVRLVATPDGEVALDRTGRRPGRGAYLCPSPACWEAALKGRRLSQALKTALSQENQARLRQELCHSEEHSDEESTTKTLRHAQGDTGGAK